MLFEVLRDNKVYMHTEHLTCINMDHVKHQASAGYRFKIDGKFVTPSQILKMVGCNHDVDATTSVPVEPVEPVKPVKPVKPKRKVRKVYCYETKTLYDNMSVAGRELGIDPAAISYSIKVNRPTTSGYTFSVIEE